VNPKPLSVAHGAATTTKAAGARCVIRGRGRGCLGPPHRRGGHPPPPLRLPPSVARLGCRPLPRLRSGSSRGRQLRDHPLLLLGQGKHGLHKTRNGALELRIMTPSRFLVRLQPQVAVKSFPAEPIRALIADQEGSYLIGGGSNGNIFLWEVRALCFLCDDFEAASPHLQGETGLGYLFPVSRPHS
jgi:hypothetical protein